MFDEEELEGLAESIRDMGLLQPLVVRTTGEERFELVAGERRLRAARKAGLQTVPAIVRDTDAGELAFPVIDGWPNQGVGRINPDGSKGACSACHTRHGFSIEVARKPHTCKECHVGPDVPVYKVYLSSKHGNIYTSKKQEWEFNAVPWTAGQPSVYTRVPCLTLSRLKRLNSKIFRSG